MANIIFILFSLFVTSSCAPLVVGGAAAGTGVALAKEKSAGAMVDDTAIWAKIKSAYLQANVNHLFTGVDVKVNEGRVLLAGHVPNAEARIEAVKLAWNERGVKEVINELTISNADTSHKLKNYSLDAWITTQVKAKLLLQKDIRSLNYNIDTVDQVVYLMGIAQNQAELDRVTRIASTISHVKKVISYVRIKD
jgi:osmotically-inducible protein OsmY